MTRSSEHPGAVLRQRAATGPLQIPGAPSALAGKLIERAGFPAAYVSGAAFSAGVLALPDVGLFTLTELVQHTQQLTRAAGLPVIVDADTGFGEPVNVERTIIELEAAGAAAIQLEDQQLPKRCGHLSGKSLVDCDAMCAKIRAAVASRARDDLVIIARTDARGVTSLDDAIARSEAYLKAGADWIFPEALANREEFEQVAKAIEAPLVANMTEFGKSPLIEFQELSQLGYAAVLYPVTLLRVAIAAMQRALTEISQSGTQGALLDSMFTRQALYELLGYDDFDRRDQQYFQPRD